MKFSNYFFLSFFILMAGVPSGVYAFNIGKALDNVGKAVKSEIESIEKDAEDLIPGQKQEEQNKQADQSFTVMDTSSAMQNAPEGGLYGSLFSKSPIDKTSPPQPVHTFTAGDNIYGILKCKGSWKEATGETYLLMYMLVDGKQMAYKAVNMQRPDLYNSDSFILDIAPEPAKMVNYSDRDIVWPEKDGYKFGPEMFTKILSELSPGEHKVRIEVKSYGKVHSAAEFTITGDNYQAYSTLLADIKAGAAKQQKMPMAGMTDIALQNKMIEILKNRGWQNIERLIIIDKDWWIDRMSGGNSPVVSRHIAASAAAADGKGGFFFSTVTFHEQKLVTGAWGPLELTHTGEKKSIPKENIHL